MSPFGFRRITSEKMLSLGIDTIASAYLTSDPAVSPSDLIMSDCVAVPVAVGCCYTAGNPCYFHSPKGLGKKGEKYMQNI